MSTSANWLAKEVRATIIASFDKVCVYCGAKLRVRAGRADGLDHVRPRAKGGSNKESNLVACCGPCNSSKGDLHLAQWLLTTDRGKAAMRRLAPVVAVLLDAAGPVPGDSTKVDSAPDSDSEVPFCLHAPPPPGGYPMIEMLGSAIITRAQLIETSACESGFRLFERLAAGQDCVSVPLSHVARLWAARDYPDFAGWLVSEGLLPHVSAPPGADLSGADLSGANLRGANLRGADLRGANLRGADLSCASLRGADLRGADLSGANLYGADLYGANLRGANLRGADLSCASLRGADLRGADLFGANLFGANLYGARGSAPVQGWKRSNGLYTRETT